MARGASCDMRWGKVAGVPRTIGHPGTTRAPIIHCNETHTEPSRGGELTRLSEFPKATGSTGVLPHDRPLFQGTANGTASQHHPSVGGVSHEPAAPHQALNLGRYGNLRDRLICKSHLCTPPSQTTGMAMKVQKETEATRRERRNNTPVSGGESHEPATARGTANLGR